MSLITCSECGKEFSNNAENCPNCGNPNKKIPEVNINIIKNKVPWSTSKLIIGIISMILFLIISLQSCTAGISNALLSNDSHSGSNGFMCALFMLIGGIISVTTKNSNNKSGSIFAIIFYWFASLFALSDYGIYKDLLIWGSVSFCFGAINLGSIFAKLDTFKEKKKRILLTIAVIILSICYLVITLSNI